jgi:GNAT superfamily N-acetyltransferase
MSGAVRVRPIDAADRPAVRAIVLERWGSPIAVGHGTVFEPGELPGFLAERDGRPVGLLTYEVRGDTLEVVSIDAFPARGGTGTALLEAAVRAAREEHGCRRVVLTTTNDNVDALRFYQRRGFRLVALRAGALEATRRIKPGLPERRARHPAARRARARTRGLTGAAAPSLNCRGRG